MTIPMIRITVTDRDSVRPADVGAHMLRAIYARHVREWRWREAGIERLSGSTALRRAVEGGDVAALLQRWEAESVRFRRQIAPYRLYP